jgi:hypothetical protein
VLVGVAIRLAYVLITSGHTPVNDELEYHREAIFIADGKWFWSTLPYGIPHECLVKPPHIVLSINAVVFGAATMSLTWLLARRLFARRLFARRLFGPLAAACAVAVLALYPSA